MKHLASLIVPLMMFTVVPEHFGFSFATHEFSEKAVEQSRVYFRNINKTFNRVVKRNALPSAISFSEPAPIYKRGGGMCKLVLNEGAIKGSRNGAWKC